MSVIIPPGAHSVVSRLNFPSNISIGATGNGAVKLPVICRSSCLAASVSLIQGGHKDHAGTRRSALSAAWSCPGRKVTTMGILDGKVAVITGGTSGIGACTAELFVRQGATTVIAGRRTAEGKAQAAKLGPKAEFVRADVSVEADVAALITGAVERHGQLDCLMNCAGEGGSPGGIASVDLDRLQRTLAIHLGGAVAGMKYAAPVMAAQRSGSIINVASIGGHIAGWTFLDYSAAKAAIIQLTRCTSAELGQHGVRVNSISPGPILTGIFGKGAGLDPARADQDATRLEPVFRARLEAYQPIGRAGEPADVAAAALWLASDASSFVTGQDLAVDGGILAGRPPAASAADFTAIAQALLPSASPS
jgi:NAD(P)-dependent dehydrogenase (short-subunit alcohol dehydrogenase family)